MAKAMKAMKAMNAMKVMTRKAAVKVKAAAPVAKKAMKKQRAMNQWFAEYLLNNKQDFEDVQEVFQHMMTAWYNDNGWDSAAEVFEGMMKRMIHACAPSIIESCWHLMMFSKDD